MLEKHTLQIIATLSFLFCIACGISLYAGACGRSQHTPNNDFLLEFVSDKLSACMHADSLEAKMLPWLFVISVFTQVVILWLVWVTFVYCDLHLKLTFHFLSFHTVLSIACVVEFVNIGIRKSAFDWFGLGRVEEQFLHVYFAVNAIIDFFLLHLCVVYAYWVAAFSSQNSYFQTLYVLDILTYFFLSLIFFMTWIVNAATTAALLEWTVLIVASSLNFWAVMLLPTNVHKQKRERKHSISSWVSFLCALMFISLFVVFVSAPPSFLYPDAGVDVLTSSTAFILTITAMTCVVAYEFWMYLLI